MESGSKYSHSIPSQHIHSIDRHASESTSRRTALPIYIYTAHAHPLPHGYPQSHPSPHHISSFPAFLSLKIPKVVTANPPLALVTSPLPLALQAHTPSVKHNTTLTNRVLHRYMTEQEMLDLGSKFSPYRCVAFASISAPKPKKLT